VPGLTRWRQALELLKGKETKHSVTTFGEDYGSYCAAWEDGACSDSIDYSKCINGPGHTCGTKKGCHDLWPDYNFNQDQTWCAHFRRGFACPLRLHSCGMALDPCLCGLGLPHDNHSRMQVLRLVVLRQCNYLQSRQVA
jgi:hypothetical protein